MVGLAVSSWLLESIKINHQNVFYYQTVMHCLFVVFIVVVVSVNTEGNVFHTVRSVMRTMFTMQNRITYGVDGFYFNDSFIQNVNELHGTISALNEQIAFLKRVINNDREKINCFKKDKVSLKRQYDTTLTSLNETQSRELKQYTENLYKDYEISKMEFLKTEKVRFEKEKSQLLNDITNKHSAEVGEIKQQLASLRHMYAQSENNSTLLSVKLQEMRKLQKESSDHFHSNRERHLKNISDMKNVLIKKGVKAGVTQVLAEEGRGIGKVPSPADTVQRSNPTRPRSSPTETHKHNSVDNQRDESAGFAESFPVVKTR